MERRVATPEKSGGGDRGRRVAGAGNLFGAHLCYGTALIFSGQAFVNMGVSSARLKATEFSVESASCKESCVNCEITNKRSES